jgi:RNA polymerase sigma-70 factor (ECF subfamily)
MARLRAGDNEAATTVFQRFAARLIRLARSRFNARLRPGSDPEEIVQSVYRSFFCRHRAGQFELGTWDDLWGLLTLITLRKCVNKVEYLQAECRDARRESSRPPSANDSSRGWELVDREPTPHQAAVLADTVEQLFRGLEGPQRQIIELSLQGYTVQEISTQLGRAERTVRRVRELIKKRLQRMREGPAS